ncbi:hypothetical protein HA402_001900 [Bradysia odoriphaga]|nr:hypothetical protein HA402_001900 [Bradysia odoriphaga]
MTEEEEKNCQISKNEPATAIAVLDSSDVKGTVIFTQTSCSGPVTIQISLKGLTAGEHGFHVHEKGDISGGCATMKSHYNPDEHNHGAQTDEIRHVGDLGNIVANADGYM